MRNIHYDSNEKSSSPRQVLLCGAKYGQVYLPAIYQKKGLELAGILARGSDQSIRLAEQYGVPFYTSIEQVDEPIDIACVAINETAGTPIARQLLHKGIATLIEHPVSGAHIQQLIAAAESADTRVHINSHFAELPPVAEFIRLAQKLNQSQAPIIINICCNSRTLFSTIDILMRCFGLIHVEELSVSALNDYRSCTMRLHSETIKNVSCTLAYQQWRYEEDSSLDSPLGHQITLTYPQGVLQLGGSFGPCMWFPLLAAGVPPEIPVCQATAASRGIPPTLQTVIEWRKYANQKVLTQLCLPAIEQPIHCSSTYMRHLCDLWSRLFAQLGTITIAEPLHLPKRYWTPEMILEQDQT
ncbi:MAG TPA: Gfo/Idh/MocA family oxidoreductase [Cellvibrio sp.]|nr:Gfo/Idh/MocA family oxidoreductase [Cellvibrio sp.]